MLKEITEEIFDRLPLSKKILCREIEFSHKFALLSVNDKVEPFALCWRSEMVKPQMINSDSSPLLWIGIDQQAIAVDKINGRIALMLTLDTNVIQLVMSEDLVILLTENEVVSFNLDGSIRSFQGLPETAQSMKIHADLAAINLINDQTITLSV